MTSCSSNFHIAGGTAVQVGFVLVWGLGPREPCETGADVMLERESPPSICPSSPNQQVAHTHTIRHLAAHAVPHVTRHTCKNHLPLLAAGFGLLRLVGCDCLAVESLMPNATGASGYDPYVRPASGERRSTYVGIEKLCMYM